MHNLLYLNPSRYCVAGFFMIPPWIRLGGNSINAKTR